jgi:S1-C subfamily serine protease
MPIECRWQAGQRSPLWHFGQRSGWSFGRVTFKTTSSAGIAGVYETDAAALHGDSGGPFVRSSGSLVGILLSINGAGKSYYMPAADAVAALEKGIVAR